MVLDGWPLTMKQVELLKSHHILPAIFVALQVSEEECARRAEKQSSQALRYKGKWEWLDAWYQSNMRTYVPDFNAFFHLKWKRVTQVAALSQSTRGV